MIRVVIFFQLLVVFLLVGRPAVAALGSVDDICVPPGKAFIPASGKAISLVDLTHKVKRRNVVLLGEHHDDADHHRWQLQMIAGLHALNGDIALGFEMFPRRSQAVLDRWVAGELTEREFLDQAGWNEFWNFDPELYLPMFRYARMNEIPMYALNVDRELVREVGRVGWSNVPEAKREGVSDYKPADRGYRELLAEVFMGHGGGHGERSQQADSASLMGDPMFNRFVESQQVWDRAMADAIANVVKDRRPSQFIAVMGSGHMMNFYGVPDQLSAQGVKNAAVLIPWGADFVCDFLSEDFADAVVGLSYAVGSAPGDDSPPKPKLGVMLEPADEGVRIAQVINSSVAAASGLEQDDLIVFMAGRGVDKVGTVIEIVQSVAPGTWLPIKVVRGSRTLEIVAKFPAATPDE